MQNKKLGTAFERKMCEVLTSAGYWVHFITPDARGAQPFDILAAKDNEPIAIECKTLASNRNWFSIDRLEQNQIMAFRKWLDVGNKKQYIAIEWRDNIYLVEFKKLYTYKKVDMRVQEAWYDGKRL